LRPSQFSGFGYFFLFIEVSNVEITAAQQGLEIGELKNPGPDRSPGRIVPLSLQVNGKEDLLENIFRLSPVAENPERH